MIRTVISFISVIALVLLATPALAAPPTLNWGPETSAGQCDTKGKPVVNVTHKVVNSVDSGFGGYWAFIDYNRKIQLWDQGDGTYCAVVSYQGQFDAEAGQQSPGNVEPLDGDEDGTFQGGYRATISGDLLDRPTWPTRGNVGVIDHDCTIAGSCPGNVNWIDQYFEPGYGFSFDWWGWIYRGGQHGTWVNASDGSSGDIT